MSFSGTEVELVGLATTSVNASNEWGFDGVAAGTYTLVFRGAGHLERRIRVRVLATGVSRFSDLELVEPGPFKLDNFDDIYRSFDSADGTIRWLKRPKRVVLDKKSLGDLPQGFDFFDMEVRTAFDTWLSEHTDGFFAGTPIQSGSIGIMEPEEFDCDEVSNGDIVIVGLDECPRDEMFVTLGTATHCFNTQGNEVVLGAIWFNPCTTEGTIRHEIIHTLCAEHLDIDKRNSIMAPSGGPDDLTEWDKDWIRYLYRRGPGTTSPDDDPVTMNPN